MNDYANVLLPPRIRAVEASGHPTIDNMKGLRDALRSVRTYTQYCTDRWRMPKIPDVAKTFDKVILPALLALPNAQTLNQVAQRYKELGEGEEPLTPDQIAEIIDLGFKGHGAIFGKKREEQARLKYYGNPDS